MSDQPQELDPTKLRMQVVLDFLLDGMSVDEALILAEVEGDEFIMYRKENPKYDKLVKKKQIEYKLKVVKAINLGITGSNADTKVAQWIAETKFSDEYSKKNKPSETNPFVNIINLIQQGKAGDIVLPKDSNAKSADTLSERLTALSEQSTNDAHALYQESIRPSPQSNVLNIKDIMEIPPEKKTP